MKKNRMMRLASILLVLVLMTSSVVGGTFAKYTTSVSAYDEARVAKWGFTQTSITLDKLFEKTYALDTTVDSTLTNGDAVSSQDQTNLIAPGTTGSATFGFTFAGEAGINAPEVAYTFKVDTKDSLCDPKIKANTNIKWKLDDGNWGTWDELITAIQALDGDEKFSPGELPVGFSKTDSNEHTVSWKWAFDKTDSIDGFTATDLDTTDTEMGNMTELDDVKLVITITATQIN